MKSGGHEIWATVSGRDKSEIAADVEALVRWGVVAIEFRVDLIPENLWDAVLGELAPPIPWWVAHFGTGNDASAVRDAVLATTRSKADGAIFHSRCEHLDELIAACHSADKGFAAPYHSQEPLTLEGALDEFAYQESLSPDFRKIAVRAHSYGDAAALVEATHRASHDGGRPAVGAVFGTQRWARIALPSAGSAITFIVARQVSNELGHDDEQLQLTELRALSTVRGMMDVPSDEAVVVSEDRDFVAVR